MASYMTHFEGLKVQENFFPYLDTIQLYEEVLFDMKACFRSAAKTPVVYTFHDKDLNILYVGKSNNFRQRWSMHRKAKDLRDVRMVVLYTHKSMADACFNEAQAIVKSQPLWNMVGINETYSEHKIPYVNKYAFIYTAENTGYAGE